LHPDTVETSLDPFQKLKEARNIYRRHSIKSSKEKKSKEVSISRKKKNRFQDNGYGFPRQTE